MPEIFRVVYCRERIFQTLEENVSFNLQRKVICIIQVSLWKTTYSVHSNSRSRCAETDLHSDSNYTQ